MKRHHDFLREAVKRHEETYQNGVVRDFADMYVRHMKGGGPLDRATFQGGMLCSNQFLKLTSHISF